jgi:hypothetical protein
MTVLDREDAIIGRLRERITDMAVETFGDVPASRESDRLKQYRLVNPVGALLVVYRGSEFGEPESTDCIVQEERVFFDVIVVAKDLRGHRGIYSRIDAVRTALTGYRVPDCGRMYPVDIAFVHEAGKTWFYAVTFAFGAIAMETAEDEQAPLLKRVTTVDNHGTTTEVP